MLYYSIDPLYLFISEKKIKQLYQELAQVMKTKHYKTIAYKYHPNIYAEANAKIKRFFESKLHDTFGDCLIELD